MFQQHLSEGFILLTVTGKYWACFKIALCFYPYVIKQRHLWKDETFGYRAKLTSFCYLNFIFSFLFLGRILNEFLDLANILSLRIFLPQKNLKWGTTRINHFANRNFANSYALSFYNIQEIWHIDLAVQRIIKCLL